MSCAWESKVALLAGGDLPEPASAVRHLSECPGCRSLYDDLSGLREEFQGAIPDLSIQSAVMEHLRRPAPRRWYWEAAAAAVLLLVALTAQQHRAHQQPPSPAVTAKLAEAGPVRQEAAPQAVVGAAPARVRKRDARPAQPRSEPAVVKLVTDDPNVVIYLVAD